MNLWSRIHRSIASDPGGDPSVETSSASERASAEAEKVASGSEVERELAQYLPNLRQMSEQLRQTSKQIEDSVVAVCGSFQGIAERSREAVERTASFLSQANGARDGARSDTHSFESLIDNCSGTLVKILSVTEEAGEISERAIERIRQMDQASQSITSAIEQLEHIAEGNKILALNARIEAARAGEHGAGFGVVAMEVISQTERSQKVNAEVNGLVRNLRTLAGSTLADLERMNERDRKRVEQCRTEADQSLHEMQAAHDKMKTMLAGITENGASVSQEIGAAVRGLQFQDRTNQRIAHVVEDLETLQNRLATRFGELPAGVVSATADAGFSAYTMQEEREVAGFHDAEAGAGEVELF